jgi:hypothetical protein
MAPGLIEQGAIGAAGVSQFRSSTLDGAKRRRIAQYASAG